ncbi:enolase-phosphatase E1 [Diatrype stigma]|uniref:Enolase-phosphatase E1 n=1 Tax=Diatrype stigma TaxID=117547 RepID=A0AAN9YKG5_9PEZI
MSWNRYPFSLRALPGVLESKWDEPEFAKYKEAFPAEHSSSKEALEAHFRELVAKDLKVAYMKDLQGYLWRQGYDSGELKAPLFADVAARLSAWHGKGVKLMIYSSGSVPAQKLLFSRTDADPSDLTPLISDWFDTVNAGPKTEKSSYETITSKHPGFAPGEWLFLSDNVKEVDAATAAGLQSYVVQRPGNPELPAGTRERLKVIESFDVLGDDLRLQ